MTWILFMIGVLSFGNGEMIHLPTNDGTTFLQGHLAFPPSKASQHPLVIMVPGTGLFDADMAFGSSNTSDDFIFVKIEEELLKLGYAVLRMNYRGVHCNRVNYPGKCKACLPAVELAQYWQACIDRETRSKVTPETMRSDFAQAFEYGANHPQMSSQRIVLFAHSEGSFHVSRLVQEKRIHPQGIVFMGGVAESPVTLVHWQFVDRFLESLLPTAAWMSRPSLEAGYIWSQNTALFTPDSEPYPNAIMPQASYGWWKMFFKENESNLEKLSNYSGSVYFHNGDRDSIVSAHRQEKHLALLSGQKAPQVHFILHPETGHTLGPDPIVGPVAPKSMAMLMTSFRALLVEPIK